MSKGKRAEEEGGNRLCGREEREREREFIYVWSAKVKEKGRYNKRKKATSHTITARARSEEGLKFCHTHRSCWRRRAQPVRMACYR